MGSSSIMKKKPSNDWEKKSSSRSSAFMVVKGAIVSPFYNGGQDVAGRQ
jgi:hypothetical protein